MFNADPEKFRIITPDVGGGFGMKLFLYAEHVLTCYAARKLGRPVKWASERSEAFLADTQGRDNVTLGELAIDADGKFLALRTRNVSNMGAYLSNFAPFIPTFAGTGVLASVYGFQAIYANVLGVFTNTVPVDAYRGAGRPEANYLVERLVDAAARELKIDRAELRRRNMVPPSAMPHTTPVGKIVRQRRFPHGARCGAERRWTTPASRRAAPRRRSAASGAASGFAYYLEATGGDPTERAEIRFADDGFVDVYVGTQSTGQGHETAYVQLTVDAAGHRRREDPHPPGRHRYDPGRRRHRRRAQPVFRGPGDPADRRLGHRQGQAGGRAKCWRRRPRTSRSPTGGSPSSAPTAASTSSRWPRRSGRRRRRAKRPPRWIPRRSRTIDFHTFPNGCHMAEVEVDPETGVVSVVRYAVFDDFGKAVNPLIVRGQVHGGVAQGIGQAVLERTAYDAGFRPAAVRQFHGLRACRAPTTCRTSRSSWSKFPAPPIRSA